MIILINIILQWYLSERESVLNGIELRLDWCSTWRETNGVAEILEGSISGREQESDDLS